VISPISKHGDLIVQAYRDWVAKLPCAHCGRTPKSEVHHFPSRGASGYTFDLRVTPLCTECHQRAHGQSVWFGNKRLSPIDAGVQTLYVALTWQRFAEVAPLETVELVMVEVRRWRLARGEVVVW
jgi:hypothetical protein